MSHKALGTTIAVLLALYLVPLASASTVVYGDHNITFVGVTGPVDGLCTWTYYVCSGEQPSISHWALESCVGTTNEVIEWGTDPELNGTISYGTDPSTGITGLKFNGIPSDMGCATFWFKVKECTVTDQEAGIKAGTDVHTGSYIEGPSHEPSAPEFAFVAIPVTIMGFVLAFSYVSAKKKYQ
jgi:hypothetical protein